MRLKVEHVYNDSVSLNKKIKDANCVEEFKQYIQGQKNAQQSSEPTKKEAEENLLDF